MYQDFFIIKIVGYFFVKLLRKSLLDKIPVNFIAKDVVKSW